MTDEMNELMSSFEEWIPFVSSLNHLSDDIWTSSIESGKWSVKDIVCHIMLWDKYFYEEAIQKIINNEPLTLKHLDYDDFNKNAVVYGQTITATELIEMAVAIRREIIEAIRSMSEATIAHHFVDADGNIFNVNQYVKDFIWHDQHHMKPLKEYFEANVI